MNLTKERENEVQPGEPVVVGVVGGSGSNRDALLRRLLRVLEPYGLEARIVVPTSVSGAGSGVTQNEGPPTQVEHAASSEADVILVNGAAWSAIPRILVVPPDENPSPSRIRGGELLWIARLRQTDNGRQAPLSDSLLHCIALEILERLHGSAPPVLVRGAIDTKAGAAEKGGRGSASARAGGLGDASERRHNDFRSPRLRRFHPRE